MGIQRCTYYSSSETNTFNLFWYFKNCHGFHNSLIFMHITFSWVSFLFLLSHPVFHESPKKDKNNALFCEQCPKEGFLFFPPTVSTWYFQVSLNWCYLNPNVICRRSTRYLIGAIKYKEVWRGCKSNLISSLIMLSMPSHQIHVCWNGDKKIVTSDCNIRKWVGLDPRQDLAF